MNINLEVLKKEDAKSLLDFEIENREYFEESVPSRGDDYYVYENFIKNHIALLEEQDQGLSYFYLIKNGHGQILGRMNLVDIDLSKKLGHIGYRVGLAHTGKGITNQALKLLIDKIEKHDFQQILAKTTTNNIASQKVLEKNGFELIETSDEVFSMNGEKVSFVYYSWSM